MEHLDLVGSVISQFEVENRFLDLEEQNRMLREELRKVASEADLETFKKFGQLIRDGRVKILPAKAPKKS